MPLQSSRWSIGFGTLACAILGVCSHPLHAGCEKDTDCKGDRICEDGVCQDPAPASDCEKDTDCLGDLICEEWACVPPTQAVDDAGAQSPPFDRNAVRTAIRDEKTWMACLTGSGGSWKGDSSFASCAKRLGYVPGSRSSSIGFRLARTA